MTTKRKVTGSALAMVAATMFATAPMTVSASSHWGKCVGGNSCKGKGFKEMSKADCDAAERERVR